MGKLNIINKKLKMWVTYIYISKLSNLKKKKFLALFQHPLFFFLLRDVMSLTSYTVLRAENHLIFCGYWAATNDLWEGFWCYFFFLSCNWLTSKWPQMQVSEEKAFKLTLKDGLRAQVLKWLCRQHLCRRKKGGMEYHKEISIFSYSCLSCNYVLYLQ